MVASLAPNPIHTVRLKNTTGKEQLVWLEPLGDRVSLRPGVQYEMDVADELGKVEIDLTENGFVIYGWTTRVTAISVDGIRSVEWQLPG